MHHRCTRRPPSSSSAVELFTRVGALHRVRGTYDGECLLLPPHKSNFQTYNQSLHKHGPGCVLDVSSPSLPCAHTMPSCCARPVSSRRAAHHSTSTQYGPAEERARVYRPCLGKSECARLQRRRRVRLDLRDTTARHTTHCARRFAPSTALRAVRAALRAARVHCSPKLLKMGYALIVGHTPAEASGRGQAASMRRTLLNALV